MNEQKDFYVNDVEHAEENNPKIAHNVIFAIAGFVLAGVSFGIGEEIFGDSWLEQVAPFVGIGISTANIRIMRDKLASKAGKNNSSIQYRKGKK